MTLDLKPNRRHVPAPAAGWEPYSQSVLTRLRSARAAALRDAALKAAETQGVSGGAPAGRPTLDDLKAQNAAMAAGFDLDIASEFGLEMDALLSPPPALLDSEPVLDRREVLLALRLAATLGGPQRVDAMCQPTAITVLEGIPPDDFDAVVTLLRHAVLPAGLRVSQSAKFFASQAEGLLIVVPAGDTRAGSASASRDLKRAFAEALSVPVGVLLLLPSPTSLEAEIAESGATRMTFVPVGRAVVLELLRIETPGETIFDATTFAATLPSDAVLAGLSDLALRAALRKPTPIDIVRALAIPPQRSTGPKLEEMSGGGDALLSARAMVADLKLWAEGSVEWSELTQSLLLHGQPGTGKAWLARAMGNGTGLGFVAASFPQWQADGHLGQMLAAMRASFAAAIAVRPSVLFIDEVDAVGSRADSDIHGANYRAQVTTGFLQEVDRLMRTEGVLLVGACNDIARIDPAVLRSGRFDRHVEVPLPDAATLEGLLRVGLGPGVDAVNAASLAGRCVGQGAAAVDAGLRAAKAAARAEGRSLTSVDLETHLPLAEVSSAGDRRAAVHEAGHAIVCAALRLGRVHRILLTPDGGQAIWTPSPNEGLIKDIEAQICFDLAGRAAERLVFTDVCSGAGGDARSDLAHATTLALHIDTRFGLGADGPLWLKPAENALLLDRATKARVRERIEQAELRAVTILEENRTLLKDLAEALLAERSIAGTALDRWLAGVPREAGDHFCH